MSARAAGRGGSAQAASTEPAPLGTDVELIGATVQRCRGVAALSGQFRSYLPGRVVAGVRADTNHVEVHIVARYGQPMSAIAAEIQRALQPLLHRRALTVGIDDIVLPDVDNTGVSGPDAPTGPPAAQRPGAS